MTETIQEGSTVGSAVAETRELYQEAARLRDNGDPAGAVALLEKAAGLAPHSSSLAHDVLLERCRLVGFRLARPEEALKLCALVTERFPNSDRAWFLRGCLLAELSRPLEALRAFATPFKGKAVDAKTAYELAKLLRSCGRMKWALHYAEHAYQLGMREFGLLGLLGQLCEATGDHEGCVNYLAVAEAFRPLPDHLRDLRDRARAVRAHSRLSAADTAAPKVRHIAIGGHSYTGSTLLGAMLGSVQGAGHAGETQELTLRRPQSDDAGVAGEFASFCRTCGPDCAVFTREFRQTLRPEGMNFYQEVGRRMGVGALVTSDKFITEFMTKDPSFDFDLIILYKPLAEWLRSYVRRKLGRREDVSADERLRLINTWIGHWTETYRTLLDSIRPTGRVVTLNWEGLVQRPHAHFNRLLQILELPGDAEYIFEHITPGHYVGGNTTDSVLKVMRQGRIEFRASDAPVLAEAEEALIVRQPAATQTFKRLQRRYRQDFAGIA
jgi:hypothetical protein